MDSFNWCELIVAARLAAQRNFTLHRNQGLALAVGKGRLLNAALAAGVTWNPSFLQRVMKNIRAELTDANGVPF